MADNKKDDEEKPLVVVTDDPKDLEEVTTDLPSKEDEEEGGEKKKKVEAKDKADDDDGEEEREDQRLGHDDEEEREEQRDRKTERQSRKQRQRMARERQERELGFLRKELDRVDRDNVEMRKRLAGQETRSYDSKIAEVERNIREAENIMKEALAAKNGDDHTEALRIRDTLLDTKRKLEEEKGEHEEREKEAPQQRRAQPDPEVVRKGQAWMSENPWFKVDERGRPQGQDSRIARAIDEALFEEGFNPKDDDYWEELDKRVRAQLKHRFKSKGRDADDDDDADERRESRNRGRDDDVDDDDGEEERQSKKQKKSGGPKFRVAGRERPLKSNEVYLPKERIEALKEAGIWDDPVERARYLKAYKNYDAEHPNT